MDMTKKKRGIWIIVITVLICSSLGLLIGCNIRNEAETIDETIEIDEAALETAPAVQADDGRMSYEKMLRYPQIQESILNQLNDIIKSYRNGTLPNSIELYNESEPYRTSVLPGETHMPSGNVSWEDLTVIVNDAGDMYNYKVIISLDKHWNMCVEAALINMKVPVTEISSPDECEIKLFNNMFFYGDNINGELIQIDHRHPAIHFDNYQGFIQAIENTVKELYNEPLRLGDLNYSQTAYAYINADILLNSGTFVKLKFDIVRENGTESYVLNKVEQEIDIKETSPYELYIKNGAHIVNPTEILTEKHITGINEILSSVEGMTEQLSFDKLLSEGYAVQAGGLAPYIRLKYTDKDKNSFDMVLRLFTPNDEPFSAETVTEDKTWDDFVWKSVYINISKQP